MGWRSGEAYALCELAACLSAEGKYGRAQAAAHEGLAIAEEIEHRGWLVLAHSGLGKLYLDLLAPRAARWHCEQAYTSAQEAGAQHLIRVTVAFLAEAFLLDQEPERAEAVLQPLVAEESAIETFRQSMLLVAYGEISLARGDPGQALRAADRVIAWAEQRGEVGVIPRLGKLQGEALAALGRTGEAEAVLRAAGEAAREQGARPLLWRLHVALGAVLHTQGRRDDAEQAYAAARSVVEDLATTIPDEALREEFWRHAHACLPTSHRPSPRNPTKRAYGGLTAREREVVTLIARGLSNRQIAEALFVSERTVETHSSHIRDKLNCTSRAQVAAWAVVQGLLPEAT
jgi:DNA-binding CsgD family transcriptional regulator